MQIIPAILEYTVADFLAQIQKLSSCFNHFQVDVQDGIFVSSKTFSIDDLLLSFSNHPSSVIRHLSFDFHLMIQDYEGEIVKLQELKNHLNIKTIFLHSSLNPIIHHLSSIITNLSFGLVLNPEDDLSLLTNHYSLATIPSIQIMSIHPGPQGQSFIPKTLQKIEQLRTFNYRGKIFLDGGVNDQTIPLIMKNIYKPDALCIGSYFTKAKNLKEAVTSITRYF